MITKYEESFKVSKSIYFKRELLVESIEKRRIELLTITSYDGITEEHEEILPDLFPELKSSEERPYQFVKKIFE